MLCIYVYNQINKKTAPNITDIILLFLFMKKLITFFNSKNIIFYFDTLLPKSTFVYI